ncbi:hypothetical protein QL285_003142 [Trifolium repens]|nr:hypothetical protein QL285_003142 [Trifolium repens]
MRCFARRNDNGVMIRKVNSSQNLNEPIRKAQFPFAITHSSIQAFINSLPTIVNRTPPSEFCSHSTYINKFANINHVSEYAALTRGSYMPSPLLSNTSNVIKVTRQ